MKTCKRCGIEKDVSAFHKNKRSPDGLEHRCKECRKKQYHNERDLILVKRKNHYEENKEEVLNRVKTRYKKKSKEIIEYQRLYCAKRRKVDPQYDMLCRLRRRISHSIAKKTNSSMDYLGTDIETYMAYLEDRFEEGMTWENRSEWHIDHIIPLSSAKNEEELVALFHYTNTQPLWAEDNLKKGARILED